MTKLDKPLTRTVEVGGDIIIVSLLPAEPRFNLGPTITFELKGHRYIYRTIPIEPPTSAERGA